MNVPILKSALKELGAKTSGTKQQLEKRLKTWKDYELDKSLVDVKLVSVLPIKEFPDNSLFKPLMLYSGLKLMNYEAIWKWFSVRSANKGLERGRILAIKLFVKYGRIFIDGENIYLQGSCCAEKKKTLDYKIKMKIVKVNSAFELVQCNCSCPAGKGWSAACKHIGAFCFSLEHFSITGKVQEYVSCTSQPLSWNKPGEGRGVDIMSIFDITGQQGMKKSISEPRANFIVNSLINNNINCPLTNHRKANCEAYLNDYSSLYIMMGTCYLGESFAFANIWLSYADAELMEEEIDVQETESASVAADVEAPDDELQCNNYNTLLYHSIRQQLQFNFIVQLASIENLTPFELKYYNESVKVSMDEVLNIAKATIEQNDELWKAKRQQRITASRCYELYTYCKNDHPDWEKKLSAFIRSKFIGNIYTDYGKKYESVAREVYEKQYGKVHLTGLLINPLYPWLGFSPDGLKMHKDIIYKIVEIKCPILGATSSVENFVTTLPYVKCDHQKMFPYYLNPKHKYYGQVQLGMFVMNLEMCDFVIYSSYDHSMIVIEVERDDEFIKDLICKLHYVYFHFYLKLVANA